MFQRHIPASIDTRGGFPEGIWLLALKIGGVVAGIWLWFRLWQVGMAFLVSIFIAIALLPVVQRLETAKLPRWFSAVVPVLVLSLVLGGLAFVALRSFQDQLPLLIAEFQGVQEATLRVFPGLDQMFRHTTDGSMLQEYGATAVTSIVRFLLLMAIGLILTLYLLLEREKTLYWVVSFIPRRHRVKSLRTVVEGRDIISAYVATNLVTSAFAGMFVFASLYLLHVPAPLLLALLAAIFDFVPVLGFIVSGVPAVLLAATVSLHTALIVCVVYVFYHFIESYFIAPKLYGERLHLSNVAILLAFAAGAELGGVIGAMLALPLAAIYPTLERIWLADYLASDVVEEHQRLEETDEPKPAAAFK